MFLSFVYTQNWFWFGCEILITMWLIFFYTRTTQLDYNVPPALCQARIFITDTYKYTEKL